MIGFIYILIFASIEVIVRFNIVSSALLPKPTEIIRLFLSDYQVLSQAFWQTSCLATGSFILAGIFAFLAGLLLHQFKFLQRAFMPLALFLQTVPIIALAPLLVIYLGFSFVTTLVAGMVVCFFPVLIATLTGLNQVDQNQNDLFNFLKASRLQKLIYLEIPSSIPLLLSGFKTSAGLAVIGVVSGEFLVGGGLGALIDSSRLQQRVDYVFASLILLAILGLFLMKLVEFLFQLLFKKYLVRS